MIEVLSFEDSIVTCYLADVPEVSGVRNGGLTKLTEVAKKSWRSSCSLFESASERVARAESVGVGRDLNADIDVDGCDGREGKKNATAL